MMPKELVGFGPVKELHIFKVSTKHIGHKRKGNNFATYLKCKVAMERKLRVM